MIDLSKAKEEFKRYVKNYDVENPNIARKISHTYRTVEVAKKIAEDLKLDEENVKLAELIALLHDIARFEQFKIYNTYSDLKSIDHGDLGVKILFEDGLIKSFVDDRKYDRIIYLAVKNHNKYKIQEGLNEEELLHCKIIRDADKTDIYVVIIEDIEKGEKALTNYKEIAKQPISKKVIDEYRKHKQTIRANIKSDIDNHINTISFIYDYNYKTGLKIIKENKYIEKLIEAVNIYDENKEQFAEILKIAKDYIDERLA